MNISDTCNAAADLIEVRGWTTGESGWDRDGQPLCLEGALLAATGIGYQFQLWKQCPAYTAVADHLGIEPVDEAMVGNLWRWNDRLVLHHMSENPHPTNSPEAHEWAREQVIATLRAVGVIHAAREDESVTAELVSK